jgi:hypothetical protein
MLALRIKGVEGETFNIATGVATTINQLIMAKRRIALQIRLRR